MKAQIWYMMNGNAPKNATNIVTFIGTKKEPVTSVTIILPPLGSASKSGREKIWKISGAQYTKHKNTNNKAPTAFIKRSRNSNKWERNVSETPSSFSAAESAWVFLESWLEFCVIV